MPQPSDSGRGAGEHPGHGSGLPGSSSGGGFPGRDPRLAGFAQGGPWDACPPGPELAVAAAEVSGPGWRCAGATDDELIGLLGRWAAVESWATAGKLGVVRELIRRRAIPVAGALGISPQAAGKLVNLAWVLEARLPGIGARLADGTLSFIKAKLIADELTVLDDAHIAAAEQMVLADLAGKTPGQLARLAALAVAAVDPEGTRKRRECAEREDARVRFWREYSGASALAAYGLPTDAALAANANISQRADEYKKAGIYPDARMDQLRALAFTDILNGISAAGRIARAQAEADARAQASAQAQAGTQAGPAGSGGSRGDGDQADPGDDGPADDGPADDGPGDDGPGPGGSTGNGSTGGAGPALPARANLTLPLATLLHLAERPGEAHGLGPLDPALARGLAAAAARRPHSTWCVTITDASGYAVGHGCARAARTARTPGKPSPPGSRAGPWRLTRADDPGPPGGYGTWTLTLPDGRGLTVRLGPVPLTGCD